jgi:ribosomal protein S18 acetylase RimI-like enzyme
VGSGHAVIQLSSEHKLAQATEDNLIGYARLHRLADAAEYYEGPDMMRLVIPGAPNPYLNGVWRARFRPNDTGQLVDKTLSLFAARDVPMMWWIGPTSRPLDLGEYLEVRGLTLVQQSAMAMELRILDHEAHNEKGFVIERVDNSRRFADWLRVNAEVFDLPESVACVLSQVFEAQGFDHDAPVCHYVGYADGGPVASSSLFKGASVAGVYNVATAPAWRGRGFGTSITRKALMDARSMGFETAVLAATKMGRSMYRRLGFEEYGKTCSYLLGDRKLVS